MIGNGRGDRHDKVSYRFSVGVINPVDRDGLPRDVKATPGKAELHRLCQFSGIPSAESILLSIPHLME